MSNHGSHLLADSGSAQTHTRYSKLSFFLAAKIPKETGSHPPPHCCFSVQVLTRTARGHSEKSPLLALGQSNTKRMPFLVLESDPARWDGGGRSGLSPWAKCSLRRHGPPHCCWRVPRPRQPLESLAPSTASLTAPPACSTTSAAAQPPAASLPSSDY